MQFGLTLRSDIDRKLAWGLAGVFAVGLTTMLGGCDTAEVRQVQQACANAPDVSKCEDAEYARRAAAERARFNYGREYP